MEVWNTQTMFGKKIGQILFQVNVTHFRMPPNPPDQPIFPPLHQTFTFLIQKEM